MKYRHLFFDLDHTLWDFDANARATLERCKPIVMAEVIKSDKQALVSFLEGLKKVSDRYALGDAGA